MVRHLNQIQAHDGHRMRTLLFPNLKRRYWTPHKTATESRPVPLGTPQTLHIEVCLETFRIRHSEVCLTTTLPSTIPTRERGSLSLLRKDPNCPGNSPLVPVLDLGIFVKSTNRRGRSSRWVRLTRNNV